MRPRRPLLRRISQERLTWLLHPFFANTGSTNPNPPPAPPPPSARGTPGPVIPHAPRCRWQHRLPPPRRHHRVPPLRLQTMICPPQHLLPAAQIPRPRRQLSSPRAKPPPKPASPTCRGWWNSASCPLDTPDGRRSTCAPVFPFPRPRFLLQSLLELLHVPPGHDSAEHGALLHPETIKHDNLLLQTAGRYSGFPRCDIRFCSFLLMESGGRVWKYLEILCISI